MNIAKILENCPKGTKLYSPLFGEVSFDYRGSALNFAYPIRVIDSSGRDHGFTSEGKYLKDYPDAECMLFPSRDNRDWSSFKIQKEYDFKPFDKVLVRDYDDQCWSCNFFSHIDGNYFCCTYGTWTYCIPYEGNEHLVGTTKNPD